MKDEQPTTALALTLTDDQQKMIAAEMEEMQFVTPELYVHRPLIGEQLNPIVGVLVGSREVSFDDFDRDKKPIKRNTTFYVLATTSPTILLDEDKKPFMAEAGKFALVCERYDLQALKKYLPVMKADEDGVLSVVNYTKVSIRPKKKVALSGGRSVWKFEVKALHMNPAAVDVPALAIPAIEVAALPESVATGKERDHGDDPSF